MRMQTAGRDVYDETLTATEPAFSSPNFPLKPMSYHRVLCLFRNVYFDLILG